MIPPHEFVRIVTLALGLTWSAMACVRIARSARLWRRRLDVLAADDPWWWRQVGVSCLRVTVLDPLNQLLLWLLLALWTLPQF